MKHRRFGLYAGFFLGFSLWAAPQCRVEDEHLARQSYDEARADYVQGLSQKVDVHLAHSHWLFFSYCSGQMSRESFCDQTAVLLQDAFKVSRSAQVRSLVFSQLLKMREWCQ